MRQPCGPRTPWRPGRLVNGGRGGESLGPWVGSLSAAGRWGLRRVWQGGRLAWQKAGEGV